MTSRSHRSATPTSSSSAPVRPARPPPTTWPSPGSTSCCWRRPRSRARRSAATASPRARSSSCSRMGIDPDPEDGWIRNQGLRIIGGGMRLELPWPDLASFPDYGLVRTREDFDEILARQAQKAGARLHERTTVTGPVLDAAPAASSASPPEQSDADGSQGTEVEFRAPLVVAADGNSTRLVARDGPAQARRPPDGCRGPHLLHQPAARRRLAGVLARALGRRPRCCPATAGSSASATAPSTSASGILNSSTAFRNVDYKDLLATLARHTRPRSGASARRTAPSRSAAPRCRWASTARRTTPAGCCSSATPAAWSTRSTARASPTRWSPARSPPRSIAQALGRARRPTAASGRWRATPGR